MDVARYIKDDKDQIRDVVLSSGIHVKAKYGPEDLEGVGFDYSRDLGNPGEYPFTRAIFAEGYRSREWTTRQYTGFGTPRETNERFKLMISHGQTGLNVAFDLPTQMGLDSDHPMADGEVGRVGKCVQRGELVKVGVNKYTSEAEHEVELHDYNEAGAEEKIRELQQLRRTRASRPVAESLAALDRAARAGENVMPALVVCCRAYATVGEMADVFRRTFGTFQEPPIFRA